MLRFSVVCIGGLLALASSAYADGPFEGPFEPIPAFTWTGFYIGGNGGYGWAANPGDITYNNLDVSAGPSASGGFGGGQIGYNWQGAFGSSFVVGIEADIQGADISDTFDGTTLGGITGSVRQELDWFGTVRGRLGWAWDQTLIYATGGFAYGHVENTSVGSGFGETISLKSDADQTGFVVGGGIEKFIASNVWFKVEYQYIDLGGESVTGFSEPSGIAIRSSPIDASFHTVRAGLNFKFY
jgi:outer membrane immunogenic protein